MSGQEKVSSNRNERLITSTKEFIALAPSIIEKVNSDQKLALLAAANPILLMDELGYKFADETRSHLEHILRFSKEKAEQLEILESEIYRIAGKRFNIDSPQELDEVLFTDLGLKRIEPKHEANETTAKPVTSPLPVQFRKEKRISDPLEELKGMHPIMEPLLAYRQLEASTYRFASPEIYGKIKNGELKLPITEITFHLPNLTAAKGEE